MPPHASLALRWSRALALTAVAVSTGVVAHVSADGLLPGLRGLIVLVALCTAMTGTFLGRRASTTRVVTLVVAGQAFIHSGLAAMAGHRGDPATTPGSTPSPGPAIVPMGTGPRTGSYFDQWSQAHPTGAVGPAVPAWMVHTATDIAAHPVMALAHVLAAVVVGLWLAVGEGALWAVLALTAAVAVRLVRALAGLVLPAFPPAAPLRRTDARPRIPRTLLHSPGVSRRGPPAVLAAH